MAPDHSNKDGWETQPPYQGPDQSRGDRGDFEKKLSGSCHCKKVRFWLSKDKPLAAKYCHCSDCKVIHGAPFQWAAIFEKSDMAFETGVHGLRFYKTSSQKSEHDLPCKVGCDHCGSLIMDEGRNMILLFPTLLDFESDEQKHNFDPQCHMFYPQRVVDIPDGKPKWTGLDEKSDLVEETEAHNGHAKRSRDE